MTSAPPSPDPEGGLSPVLGRPSPASAREPRLGTRGAASGASYRAAGGSGDWFGLRAVTIAGVRHRLAGEPNQDSFAWAVGDTAVAVSVADGLGSVEGSERAAEAASAAAAHAAVDAMDTADSDEADPQGVLAAARAAICAANRSSGDGGATTLVVAVVHRSGTAAVARVGDSSGFLLRTAGDEWSELFEPPQPDAGLIEVATASLPAQEPEMECVSLELRPDEVLVLVTDGIADPWRDGPESVAPALAAWLSGRPSPLELAALADFSRQGCHDDRTVAVLWIDG